MKKYLNTDLAIFFIILTSVTIILTYLSHHILLSDKFYYDFLSNTIAQNRISSYISQQRIIQKIGYFFIPLVIILRAFYTSCCLYVGCFFEENDISFSKCLNISLKADIVFLLELFIKIDYLLFFGFSSLDEFNIRPLSLFQLLSSHIEPWARYPFFVLNLFELLYWYLLVVFFSYYNNKGFWKSLLFVFKTYGLGLLVWIVIVMFISINIL